VRSLPWGGPYLPSGTAASSTRSKNSLKSGQDVYAQENLGDLLAARGARGTGVGRRRPAIRAGVRPAGLTPPSGAGDIRMKNGLAIEASAAGRSSSSHPRHRGDLSHALVHAAAAAGGAGEYRGAMGIAGGLWRVETRVTHSVSSSIPARRRTFCPSGDLGSRNHPFSRRIPEWMAQGAVVRDYRALETGRRRARRIK
jgi:hypothetical protein